MHLFIYVRIQCFLTPVSGSGIGMEKNSRSGINIPDHISESLVEKFGGKILEFFVADPDPKSAIRCIFDPGYPSRIRNTGRL